MEEPIDVAAHPELAQAIEEFIRRAQANWVDETIPVLGRLTPRKAATDRGRVAVRHGLSISLDMII